MLKFLLLFRLSPLTENVFRLYRLLNKELCYLHSSSNITRMIKSRRIRRAGHVARMGSAEAHRGLRWGHPMEWDHMEEPGVDGRIILKWIFRKCEVAVCTGLIWLRIGTVGGHLQTRKWTFRFHKIPGFSWLVENRLVSQEGLCSME
jgi:hypothetical protein